QDECSRKAAAKRVQISVSISTTISVAMASNAFTTSSRLTVDGNSTVATALNNGTPQLGALCLLLSKCTMFVPLCLITDDNSRTIPGLSLPVMTNFRCCCSFRLLDTP